LKLFPEGSFRNAMSVAWFRFYEELNDFLPASRRKQSFPFTFMGSPSVKDVIESLGVPHVEVDLILVNGISVSFSCKVNDKDLISVYPVFESLDISGVTHLRDKPLREVKFIPDVHLGKLVKYLRLCGFDTYYDKNINDDEIISISVSDKRIILTRDRGLLKNKRVTHGYWIRSSYPGDQFREVYRRFGLQSGLKLFTRCMECNGILEEVRKDRISVHLLPKTRKYYRDFRRCPGCNRIYWEGSHYEKMKKQIKKMLD
jgi:uncharacterized protein with PIN domain